VWTPPPRGRPSSLAQHCTLYLPQGAFVAHLRRNPRKFRHPKSTKKINISDFRGGAQRLLSRLETTHTTDPLTG
ncbi:hypothetical protein, partial [Photorhabdus sp. RM157S]|uniref:hypothetical protein n=1 Tax=Photorhabdus sp. RM157S TaxID=3342827 RepID=UPI0036DCD576